MSGKTDVEALNRILRQYKFATDLTTSVCIVDKSKNISYANDRFLKTYGYSKEETTGKTLELIRHSDTKDDALKQMWETLLAKKIYRSKMKNKTKEGASNITDIYAIPILGPDKAISDFIFLMRDITSYEMEKKKRETNILKSKTEMMNKFKKEKIQMQNQVKDFQRQASFQNQEMKNALLEAEKYRTRADTLAIKLKEASFLVGFDNIYQSEVIRAKRYGRPFSVVCFGIDRMESILDAVDKQYMVDKMIYKFKATVQDTIRICDYLVRDGDSYNFIMLLPETPGPGAKRAVEKINEKLQKILPKFEGKLLTSTWVVGEIDRTRDDAENLLEEAKALLEDVKAQGRGRIVMLNELDPGAQPGAQIPAAQAETQAAAAAPVTSSTAPTPQPAAAEPQAEEDELDDEFLNDDFFDDDF